ncbi:MAG: hypothetical protein OEQ12_03080 [Nitrosopumilus sp.]|nr:hypothetical protein [Nitrosopumilus sp.]
MTKPVPKKQKTGLFSHDQREKLCSTDPDVKLKGEQKRQLVKPGKDFDQRLDAILQDIKILLERPDIQDTLFAKNKERFAKFYALVDTIRIFDDFEPPENQAKQQMYNMHSFDRAPKFTIQRQKNGSFKKIPVIYKQNEMAKIAKKFPKPEYFYDIIKNNTHLTDKQWKFLENVFNDQIGKVVFPFVIPSSIKEGKQYTWKQIEKAFRDQFNKL